MEFVNAFVKAKGTTSFVHKDGKVVFNPVDLKAGEMLKYQITVKAVKPCYTKNTVLLQSPDFSKVLQMEESTNFDQASLPSIHMSGYDTEDPVKVGQNTIYVVDVRNEGNVACNNVKVCIVVPEEMEFVNAKAKIPFQLEKNNVVFQTVPVLEGNKSSISR